MYKTKLGDRIKNNHTGEIYTVTGDTYSVCVISRDVDWDTIQTSIPHADGHSMRINLPRAKIGPGMEYSVISTDDSPESLKKNVEFFQEEFEAMCKIYRSHITVNPYTNQPFVGEQTNQNETT